MALLFTACAVCLCIEKGEPMRKNQSKMIDISVGYNYCPAECARLEKKKKSLTVSFRSPYISVRSFPHQPPPPLGLEITIRVITMGNFGRCKSDKFDLYIWLMAFPASEG